MEFQTRPGCVETTKRDTKSEPCVYLLLAAQFLEETPSICSRSGPGFYSMPFDFSLGKEPPPHDTDDSFVFETVVNKLRLTRLPESFPQKLPGSPTAGHVYW